MKKCPSCDKTFEDSMKFCQVDGTPLVDAEPAFDPYATMVAKPGDIEPAKEEAPAESFTPQPEEPVAPISEPANVLEMPEADPLKTMYVSEAEMKEAFGQGSEEPVIEMPPAPEPPSFSSPEPPPPSFGDMTPPPSPFSTPEPEAASSEPPPFEEPSTVMQPQPFEPPPPPAPAAEWTPPAAPDAAWQNQPIGTNTPFQPPAAGTAPNTTLALVSLILGIASFVCLGVLGSVPAVITGFMARSRAAANPNEYGGAGMAMGGIILGFINIVITAIVLVFYIVVILANMR